MKLSKCTKFYDMASSFSATCGVFSLCLIPWACSSQETIATTRKIRGAVRATLNRNLDLFYGKSGSTSNGDLDQICRRFPLWRGSLRQECGEYLQFDPQRPDWWFEDVEEAINGAVTGSSMKDMEACIEGEFLEYIKSWPE